MLVSLTACSGEEDDELIRPDGKWGIIEGYVLGGGQPVAADVSVRQLGHAELDGTFETRSDSSGWYSLMVPAGNYRLGAENLYYAAAGICLSWRDADTVITTGDRVRADFLGAALSVHLDLPEEWEGYWVYSEIGEVEEGRFRSIAGTRDSVANGEADLQFRLLPAGAWVARCEVYEGAEYFAGEINNEDPQFFLPATEDLALAERIPLAVGESRDYEARVDPLGHISGSITGSWQVLGTSRPYVWAFGPDSIALATTRAETDGSFDVEIVGTAAVRLLFEIGGLRRWLGGDRLADARVFAMESGVRFDDAHSVEYAITCRADWPGLDIPRGCVGLYNDRGHCVVEGYCQSFRGDAVTIPNLEPGAYFIHVRPASSDQNWCPQWFDQQDSSAAATPVIVGGPDEIVTVTLRLVKGGSLAGCLIWFGEDPTSWRLRPRGLVVRSTDGSYEDWDAGDVDEARRTYAIRGLADGDYHLGIHYGEDRVWWYPGTLDAAGAGVLSIAGHADLAGIDWFCPRAYPGEVQ